MRKHFATKSGRQSWLSGLLLVSLVFRALIPAGFMPSSTVAFSLEMCRGANFAQLERRDSSAPHQPGHSSASDPCPFGSAPAAGPVAAFTQVFPSQAAAREISANPVPPRLITRLERAQQARAPPLPA